LVKQKQEKVKDKKEGRGETIKEEGQACCETKPFGEAEVKDDEGQW
jgi:hypothetical protein